MGSHCQDGRRRRDAYGGNCARMGPRAELEEAAVSESIRTGGHFLGCAACGTYCRHNGAVQTLHDFFRSTGDAQASPDARALWGAIMSAGRATRTDTPMDRCGEARTQIAFDVGIVEPNSNSHSARSGCNRSFLNVNAGTRDEERERKSSGTKFYATSAG